MAKKTTQVLEPPINEHEWRLFGKCQHNNDKTGTTAGTPIDGGITYEEQHSKVGWRKKPIKSKLTATPSANIFGKPVDGNTAVTMIRDAGSGFLAQEALANLSAQNGSKRKAAKKSPFIDFVNNSNGKTFDKTIVLKILSQPNCEALRIYHALRDGKEPSYVLVGVDMNGFDLNFDPDTIPSLADPSSNVPNNSLMAEYGYPPGSKDFNDQSDIDHHYVLLKLAQQRNKKIEGK